MDGLLVDGLTEQEWQFLKTPVRDLSPDERMIAISVHDKKVKHIVEQNEIYRKEMAARQPEELWRRTNGDGNDSDKVSDGSDISARTDVADNGGNDSEVRPS